MRHLSLIPISLFLLGPLAACGASNGGAGPIVNDYWMPYAQGVALVSFLNDGDVTTFEVLDDVCAIRSDAAAQIMLYRNGPDGVFGTADDHLFSRVQEIEAVYRVGPVSMQDLLTCADDFGYVPPEVDLRMLGFLNDRHDTDAARLNEDCGLRLDVADAILEHRNGKDGLVGTGDDRLFGTVEELDSIAGVSEDTLADLRRCADYFEGVQPDGGMVR